MFIKKLQVFNYKSYFDSGVMEFAPGINIIVGRNNAGKTSLLEVLTLFFGNHPHKSLKTLPNKASKIEEKTRIKLTFHIAPEESHYVLIRSLFEKSLTSLEEKQDFLEINISMYCNMKIDNGIPEENKIHNGYEIFTGKLNKFIRSIYRFKAERLNLDICKLENNTILQSDASNLAEVICILQGKKPGMFAQFNTLVSEIMPEVKYISVVSRNDSNVEIRVWTTENLSRDDLSLPLSLCGSGVSQVLAIVYILVSSEEPRIIIIDEPQSFLHPGAARKLIETIKQFPQHQYFIATHSPDIITTADPSKIIKLKYQDCETTASVVNSKEIESQNEILDELGVRLSDVFGADKILWVEGKTEEICFPLILEKVLHKQLRGTKILGVINPGDFQGTRASLIFDIYQKLSGGTHLFPPAIGFLFDRENRTEEDKRKWQDISKKPVEFLSRRMYENYLLDSEAIAVVLNEDNQSRPEPFPIHLTSAEVEEWLEKKKQEKGCSEEEWLSEVDGSNLLKDLFRELSGSKLSFYKTKKHYNHSYKLTKWLVENKPDFLLGLAEEVAKMLNY